MQADLSRRRSDSTEDTARTKAPSIQGTSYAQKTAMNFGDTGTALSMQGFTPQRADAINAKQKADVMRKLPSAFGK
jgi:hypothetical protein